MEKPTEKTLPELTELITNTDAVFGGSCAPAVTAALACSRGVAACNKAADSDELRKNLDAIRQYMLRMADEDGKAVEPLARYAALPEDDQRRKDHLEASLRVACYVPTEVMYACGQAITLLDRLAEQCSEDVSYCVAEARELCSAALVSSQRVLLAFASRMDDEVFAMTLERECELVRQQYLSE